MRVIKTISHVNQKATLFNSLAVIEVNQIGQRRNVSQDFYENLASFQCLKSLVRN